MIICTYTVYIFYYYCVLCMYLSAFGAISLSSVGEFIFFYISLCDTVYFGIFKTTLMKMFVSDRISV